MKEEYIKRINKYFKNRLIRNKFIEQLNLFFNIENPNKNNYKKGEEVLLTKNHLLHGTRIKIDDIYKIKENGLLAVEFYDKEYPNQKNHIHVNFGNLTKILN